MYDDEVDEDLPAEDEVQMDEDEALPAEEEVPQDDDDQEQMEANSGPQSQISVEQAEDVEYPLDEYEEEKGKPGLQSLSQRICIGLSANHSQLSRESAQKGAKVEEDLDEENYEDEAEDIEIENEGDNYEQPVCQQVDQDYY